MTKLSIDRLTFLGDISGSLMLHLENTEHLKKKGFSQYPYREYYQFLDGSILQIAETGAVRSGKIQQLRYEFNPNNSTYEKIHMGVLRYFKHARVSRVDIAMDVFDVDMTQWQWIDKKSRKQNHWLDGKGNKETVYVGGKDADLKLRIYNKAVEQNEEDKTWWRVEVQLRGEIAETYRKFSAQGHVNINPFEDVFPVTKGDYSKLPLKERALIMYLVDNPAGFSEMASNTRAKYKKILESYAKYDEVDLKSMWNEKSPELGSELDSWYKLTDRLRF